MKELQTQSIVAPGFFGLNTQESGVTLSPNFAQLADNVVIDKYGRLGARKGWVMQTTSGSSALSGQPVRFIHEHISAAGSSVYLSGGNNKVFSGGVGASLTDITPASYTITNNNWSGATINAHTVMVQEGHEPLVYNSTASPVLKKMSTFTGLTQNYGTDYPKHIIAAYGRYWALSGSTVYWSTDIADPAFPSFSGGTSGSLNIASVLPNNVDTLMSIAVHNDFLVIFAKNNIVLYSGARNPIGTEFMLADLIAGVGCAAKKSVQATGNDLIFLSDTGVRSLSRLIQEKSLPMRDLTKNIRDDFLKDVNAELASYGSLDRVCSVYSETEAFYLISFPATSTVYVLDMRSPLQDGSARCTVWYTYPAYSFLRDTNRNLYIGKTNGIGLYSGYKDNNVKYRLRYFSHYLSFGNNTVNKLLKQVRVTVLGGSNQQFTIKIGGDYTASYLSYPFTVTTGTISEYGVAEYGANATTKAYYSGGVIIDDIKSSVGGSGNVIQIGFEADVNGDALSVQSIDCYLKTGRIG